MSSSGTPVSTGVSGRSLSREELRTVVERNARALQLRPSIGQGTAKTKVRLTDGLACDVEEGDWRLRVDMSPKSGGASTGPNPGVLGRASLGSCLAIGYAMWAARRNVSLRSVEIEVQADYDTCAEYGIGDAKPGYQQVRCRVTVTTDGSREEVERLLEEANQASSYLHVWRDPQDVKLEIQVVGGE